MKTRERKQEDLNALTERLNNSKSAMVVGFNKLTVNKDQEFRNYLRDAGANFQVVKNTLARIAVKGTPYEGASEHFKGVTGIAWTETDAVILSKAVSKFVKDNADIYTFKAGIVEGRVVNLKQVEAIASLPSKEELISKLMFVINAQAQRIVTVINAVPRNLAIVIKQIGDQKTDAPAAEQKAETVTEQAAAVPEEAAVSEQNGGVQEDAAAVATEQNDEPMAATDAPEAEKSE
jgi:large subunit ribosomal protein L10